MKSRLLTIIVILNTVFFLISCGKENSDKNTITNSFEHIDGWHENAQLVKGDAHSGNYCLKIISEHPYSLTFSKKIGDLELKSIGEIKISAWVKFADLNSNAKIVVSIDSSGSATAFFWAGIDAQDFISDRNQWFEITGEIILPKVNNKDYKLLVYLWNTGKNPVFLDDFSFQLIEGK